MKFVAILIVFVFSGLVASGPHAEIYSWTDEKGVKHYSHSPPADRSLRIKTASEIPGNSSGIRQPVTIYEENVETLLEELDKENIPSTATGSEQRQEPSRQQRIQNERIKLEEKLDYLESLPADSFANSRSRDVIIGKYRYRLEQLRSDPDHYFEQYGF